MDYSHLVEIDEATRKVHIFRISSLNRDKQLFTSADFPAKPFDEDKLAFQRFAVQLGENLLLDSPAARRLMQI
jgi:hypothetical protein